MHFRWGHILAVCAQLASLGLLLLSDMAAVSVSEVRAIAADSPFPSATRSIWSIACSSSSATSSDAEYLAPARETFTQNDLVLATRRHSAQYAASGRLSARVKRNLRVPRSLSMIGPAHRIRLRKSSAIPPRVSDRYVNDATQANLVNQAKGPFRGWNPPSASIPLVAN